MPDEKGFWGRLSTSAPPPDPGSWQFKAWRRLNRVHVWLMRRGVLGRMDEMPVCVVHNRGAKTGEPRETPLTYLPDGERVVLIASYGGYAKNPAWYHNLKAHPDIEIERDGRREAMTAHQADAAERAALWPRIVAMNPGYAEYQTRTTREIPVMVCAPRSP